MPNWASGEVSVIGKKDSLLRFASRFIYEDADRDLTKPLTWVSNLRGACLAACFLKTQIKYPAL